MGDRGRKPAAEQNVVHLAPPSRRPDPPAEMTAEQALIWRDVVDANKFEHFGTDTQPLLVRYCQHVATGRKIEQLRRAAESKKTLDVEHYDRLTKMAERESRILASLAVKMRISQSTTDDRRQKKPTAAPKPWEAAS